MCAAIGTFAATGTLLHIARIGIGNNSHGGESEDEQKRYGENLFQDAATKLHKYFTVNFN